MKLPKEKITLYLNPEVAKFLKTCKNKTEVINNAMEEFILKNRRRAFIQRLKTIKPVKSNISITEVMRKVRDED